MDIAAATGFGGAIASLLTSAAVVMGSPGPSTVSVTAVAAAFGFRRSLPYAAGLILGTIVVLCCVAAGAGALLHAAPAIAPVLTTAASFYLLWLAWRIATAPTLKDPAGATAAHSALSGLLLALANPKAWLAIGAIFAGASIPGLSPLEASWLKTALLAGMIVLIHLVWLLGGASLSQILRDPRRARIANIAFAVLLAASIILAWRA